MAEITPAGGGPNRLFIVLALGLGGLLVIGIIALGGFFVVQNMLRPPAAPTLRVAITSPTRGLASPTLAPTSTEAATSAATPTLVLGGTVGTLAIVGGAGTGTPAATPGTGQLPQSGLGEDLLLLAAGVILVLIVIAARRARTRTVP